MLQDLTSFKHYHQVVISQDLDLTLLYADWTSQEINSLTHCSTTGKPTRSFATERVSLDSAVERTLSQLLPGANKNENALRLRSKAFICLVDSEKMDSVVKT